MFKLLTSKSKTSKKGLAPNPPPTNGGRQDPLPQHYSKPLPPSPGAHPGPVQHHQNPYSNPYPYQGHPQKKQIPQHHQIHQTQQRAPMFVPPLRSTNVQYTQFSSSAAKAAENINQRAQHGRMPPQLQNILIPPMDFELESHHQQFHHPRAPTLEGHRPASHHQLHQMHQTHNMESVPRHHSRMPSGSGEGYFSRGKGREEMPYMHMLSGETRSTSMRPSVSEPPITTMRTSRALPPRPIPISIQRSESDSEPVEMIQLGRQSVLRGQPMRATLSLPNSDQSQLHPQPRQPPRWKFLEDLRRKAPEPKTFPPDPVPSPQVQMVEIPSEASTVEPVEARKDEIFKDDFKLKSFSRFEKAAEIQKQQRNIEKPKVEEPSVSENLELKQIQIKENSTLLQTPAAEKAETVKADSPVSSHKEASMQVSVNSHQEAEAPTEKPMQVETGESYFKREPHLLTLLTNEFKSGTSEEHSLPVPSDIPNSPKILLRDRSLLHAASGLIQKFTALPESSHETTIQAKYSGLAWNKPKKIDSQAEAKVGTPKVESQSVAKSKPNSEDGSDISIGRSRNNNAKPRPKTVVENLRTKFEMKIQEASGIAIQSKNISTTMSESTSLPKPIPRPATANSARRKMTKSLGSLRRTQQFQVTSPTTLPSSNTPEDDISQSSALKWKLEALSRKPDQIDQLEPPSFLDSIGKKVVNNNSWRAGSVSNSIASLRSPPIGLDADDEVGDSPSLALQLEMGELRIQMEMWRKKFREEQNAKSDLEAEFSAKETRMKDLHTEETTSIKNLCSRRIRELVHVIRELQDLNLQFRTLLKENNIEIPGINISLSCASPRSSLYSHLRCSPLQRKFQRLLLLR
ncbi:hypothetical protein DSO57_1019630 [Entomophthora muscae]|uniref:Uncharacterized protein n=1 Tax=Entomophthora muscae TaxID=34485 RepID=A0ACC2SSU6_9FUNG|nr:hypothetical protein DSO57_1019630 [Entomophthora muscae]